MASEQTSVSYQYSISASKQGEGREEASIQGRRLVHATTYTPQIGTLAATTSPASSSFVGNSCSISPPDTSTHSSTRLGPTVMSPGDSSRICSTVICTRSCAISSSVDTLSSPLPASDLRSVSSCAMGSSPCSNLASSVSLSSPGPIVAHGLSPGNLSSTNTPLIAPSTCTSPSSLTTLSSSSPSPAAILACTSPSSVATPPGTSFQSLSTLPVTSAPLLGTLSHPHTAISPTPSVIALSCSSTSTSTSTHACNESTGTRTPPTNSVLSCANSRMEQNAILAAPNPTVSTSNIPAQSAENADSARDSDDNVAVQSRDTKTTIITKMSSPVSSEKDKVNQQTRVISISQSQNNHDAIEKDAKEPITSTKSSLIGMDITEMDDNTSDKLSDSANGSFTLVTGYRKEVEIFSAESASQNNSSLRHCHAEPSKEQQPMELFATEATPLITHSATPTPQDVKQLQQTPPQPFSPNHSATSLQPMPLEQERFASLPICLKQVNINKGESACTSSEAGAVGVGAIADSNHAKTENAEKQANNNQNETPQKTPQKNSIPSTTPTSSFVAMEIDTNVRNENKASALHNIVTMAEPNEKSEIDSSVSNNVLDLSLSCKTPPGELKREETQDVKLSPSQSSDLDKVTAFVKKSHKTNKECSSKSLVTKNARPQLHRSVSATSMPSSGKGAQSSTVMSSDARVSFVSSHSPQLRDNPQKLKSALTQPSHSERSHSRPSSANTENNPDIIKLEPDSKSIDKSSKKSIERLSVDTMPQSPHYMSFDPRILQFYSDEDRMKLVESGFIPPFYSSSASSSRDFYVSESAHVSTSGRVESLESLQKGSLSGGDSIAPSFSRSLSLDMSTRHTPSSSFMESNAFKSLNQKLIAEQAASLHTARANPNSRKNKNEEESLKIPVYSTNSKDTRVKNTLSSSKDAPFRAGVSKNLDKTRRTNSKSYSSKLSCRNEAGRKLDHSSTPQSTGTIPVGIAIARKRTDALDRKDAERQRSTTPASHATDAPSNPHRDDIRTSRSSDLAGSGLSSNLVITGGNSSSFGLNPIHRSTTPSTNRSSTPAPSPSLSASISTPPHTLDLMTRPSASTSLSPGAATSGGTRSYWLGHGVYSLPAPTREGAELQYNPPPGYKITQDPLTSQLFIIPDVQGSYYGCVSPQQPSPSTSSTSTRSLNDPRRTPSTPALLSPTLSIGPESRRTPTSDTRATPTPSTLLSPAANKQRQDAPKTTKPLLSPMTSMPGYKSVSATRRDLLSPSPMLSDLSGVRTPPVSASLTALAAAQALLPSHPLFPAIPSPAAHPFNFTYPYSPYYWNPSAYTAQPPSSRNLIPRWPPSAPNSVQNRATSPIDFSIRKREATPISPPPVSTKKKKVFVEVTVQTSQNEVADSFVQTDDSCIDLLSKPVIKSEQNIEQIPEVKKSFSDTCVQTDSESLKNNAVDLPSNSLCSTCHCPRSATKDKQGIEAQTSSQQAIVEQSNVANERSVEDTSLDVYSPGALDGLHILSTLALHSTNIGIPTLQTSAEQNPYRFTPLVSNNLVGTKGADIMDLTRPLSIDTSMTSARYGYGHSFTNSISTVSSAPTAPSPDLASDYNVPKSIYFDDELLRRRRPSKASSLSEDEMSNVFKIGTGVGHMDAKEVEVRSKLAEIQRRYKEKQQQLARLKPKAKGTSAKKSSASVGKKRRASSKSLSSDGGIVSSNTPVVSSNCSTTIAAGSGCGAHNKPSSCPRTKAQMKYMKPREVESTGQVHVTVSEDSDMGELSSMLEDTCLETSPVMKTRTGNAKKKLPFSASFHDNTSPPNVTTNKFSSSLGILAQYASSQMENSSAYAKKRGNMSRKQSSDDTDSADTKDKKRKRGRPKKYSPAYAPTQTIVSKTSKNFSFFNMGKSVKRMKAMKEGSRTSILKAVSEWNRRRSERIFLNDALSPTSTVSSSSGPTSPAPPPSKSRICAPIKPSLLSSALSQTKMSPKESDLRPMRVPTLAERVVKPAVMKTYSKQMNQQVTLASTTSARNLRNTFSSESSDSEDSDSDRSSSSSESDAQPRHQLIKVTTDAKDVEEKVPESFRSTSHVPEVRSSVLKEDDLYDGLKILYFMEGLFYEARVKEIQAPDVYGVLVKGERGNRPHIMSREELLNDAVMDVRPLSLGNVPVGRRVCAYWSQQFSCLYPGLVVNPGNAPVPKQGGGSKANKLVNVEFDDGDDGNIPLEHVRLLPQSFPVQSYDDDPPCPSPGKRKKRSISEDLLADSWRERKPSLPDTLTRYQLMERQKAEAKRKMEMLRQKQETKQPGTIDSGIAKTSQDSPVSKDVQNESFITPRLKRAMSAVETGRKTQHAPAENKNSTPVLNRSAMKMKKSVTKVANRGTTNIDSDSENDDVIHHEESDDDVILNSKAPETPVKLNTLQKKRGSVSKASTATPPRRKSQAGKGRSLSCSTPEKRERKNSTHMLPHHQIWAWMGSGTKRPKKTFYKAIKRGHEILRIGDCAVFLTVGRPNLPYIGRIESLFETRGGSPTVRVKWFYHPEETKGGKRIAQIKGALFESPHGDENDVQTISHKCEVISYTRYKTLVAQNAKSKDKSGPSSSTTDGDNWSVGTTASEMDNVYYLAGFYDPTANVIKFEGDVKMQGKSW